MINLTKKFERDNKKRRIMGDPPAVSYRWYNGIPIIIENEQGSVRHWHDHKDSGKSFMDYAYGYIPDTMGIDGDEIDVYVGPDYSDNVFIIYQLKAPDFEELDEWKVMLGFLTADQATEAYMCQYDQAEFYGKCETVSMDLFINVILADHPIYAELEHLFLIDDVEHAILLPLLGTDRTNFVDKLYIDPTLGKSKSPPSYTDANKDDANVVGAFKKDAIKGEVKKSATTEFLNSFAKASTEAAEAVRERTEALSKALTSAVVSGFSKRPNSPWKAPVAHEQGLPVNFTAATDAGKIATPILKATPVDTDAVDIYKSCNSCGRMHKSTASCTRCDRLSDMNKSVTFATYE